MRFNERQIKAILYMAEGNQLTNAKYQELNDIGKTLATEELQDLVQKDLISQVGTKGRSSKYVLK